MVAQCCLPPDRTVLFQMMKTIVSVVDVLALEPTCVGWCAQCVRFSGLQTRAPLLEPPTESIKRKWPLNL